MKLRTILLLPLVLAVAFCGTVMQSAGADAKAAFTFRDVGYFHRWSQNTQHEFTPAGQEDLKKWADMVTLNAYTHVRDGDALAAVANALLENYKTHKAMVLKTNSVPRTPNREAEHFVAAIFARPEFIEVSFTRLKMVDGAGCSIVYSHRMYGEKIGDQMSAWLKTNAPAVEKALMELSSFPSPVAFGKEVGRTKT